MNTPYQAVTSFIPILLAEGLSQSANSPLSPQRLMALYNKSVNDFANWGSQMYRPELVTYLNAQIEDTETGLLDVRYPSYASKLVSIQYGRNKSPKNEEPTIRATYPQAGVTYSPNGSEIRYRIGQPVASGETNPGRGVQSGIFISPPNGWPGISGEQYFRINFSQAPPSVHYAPTGSGQTSSSSLLKLNTSPTAGSFQFPASRYVGQNVFIYSGPGAGQFARIASISGTTATCVGMDDPDDAAPFATAITSASYYEILPWVPFQFLDTLALYTAAQVNKNEAARTLATLGADIETFRNWLKDVDMANGKPVNRAFRNDMGMSPGGFSTNSSGTTSNFM